jgi:hypothetical protein
MLLSDHMVIHNGTTILFLICYCNPTFQLNALRSVLVHPFGRLVALLTIHSSFIFIILFLVMRLAIYSSSWIMPFAGRRK